MDADIREALTDIKKDVREGFRDVGEQIKDLITRGEFRATVERLDKADQITNERLTGVNSVLQDHIKKSERVVEDIQDADREVAKQAKEEIISVRKEMHQMINEQKATIQRTIVLAISVAGVLIALANYATPFIERFFTGVPAP